MFRLSAASGMVMLLALGGCLDRDSDRSRQDFTDPDLAASVWPEISVLDQAMQDYEEGRYEDAITGFERDLAGSPGHTGSQFLLGLCFLETGRTDEAAQAFEDVRVNDPERYGEASWYLGLARFKAGDMTYARQLMEELMAGDDPYYAARAKILFDRFL